MAESFSMGDIKEQYHDWAETYDSDAKGRSYSTPKKIAEKLKHNLKIGSSIIDLGCGTGLNGK